MRAAIVFLILMNSAFGQVVNASKETSAEGLTVEVRMSSSHVQLTDEISVSVYFRSPEKEITIWNALDWGAPAGLHLLVLDSSGHEVRNDFVQMFHPLPPDMTGRDALISIGGNVFAGFDSQISAKSLFPWPGRYKIKCLNSPPLPRNYFQGHTIWGREDPPIASAGVPVLVDK
jgi:hypothetical protein